MYSFLTHSWVEMNASGDQSGKSNAFKFVKYELDINVFLFFLVSSFSVKVTYAFFVYLEAMD